MDSLTIAAIAVLFGAEMPPTGADPTAWPSLVVALSKLLYLLALAGWAITLWKERARVQR